MTNDRVERQIPSYGPPTLFNQPQTAQGARDTPGGNRFRILRTKGNLSYWELRIADVTGGLGLLAGDYNDGPIKAASSSLDTRASRHLNLLPLTTTALTPDPGGTLIGLSHLNIFNTLLLGLGSTANSSLFKETSATDPTITTVTYTPTSSITGIWEAAFGSATATPMAVVGRLSHAAQVLSDASGTVNATMHADVNPLWGLLQTPLNSDTILLYYGTVIATLAKTAAQTAQPTTVLSNVPGGGTSIAILSPGGGPLRAFWLFPAAHNTGGMQSLGTEKPGKIIHTNLEGSDPRELRIGGVRGIQYVGAVPARQGMMFSDAEVVIWWNGTQIIDTRPFNDLDPATYGQVFDCECRGFWVFDSDVYMFCQGTNLAATANLVWVMKYDFNIGTWHQVGKMETCTAASDAAVGVGPIHTRPFSASTQFLHRYHDGSWKRQWQPLPGYNSYQARRTANAPNGQEFASPGTWTSPRWRLPLTGPHQVLGIGFEGEIEAEGGPTTLGKVEVTAGGFTATFTSGFNPSADAGAASDQYATNPDTSSMFAFLQVVITATQQSGGTDEGRRTPDALPIVIHGVSHSQEIPEREWRKQTRGR